MIIIDSNKYGAVYPVKKSISGDNQSLKAKIEAFGFNTTILEGHNEKDLEKIKVTENGLNAFILDTVKGKGLDFLEESHAHGFNFFYEPEKYEEVMKKFNKDN